MSAADPRAHGGGHGVAMRKFWLKGNFAGKSLDNGENDGENHGTNQGKMMGTLLKNEILKREIHEVTEGFFVGNHGEIGEKSSQSTDVNSGFVP